MQTKGLHKSIYKLYGYTRKQECLDAYRKKYEFIVREWERFKAKGLKDALVKEIVGYSRATYYRAKKVLAEMQRGILPPSKAPKHHNKPQWGEADKQLVLRIRRENPTYGKDKIGVILRRDHGSTLSNSSVGRILNFLKKKGLVTKSMSALRARRKRTFKGHAKPWTYKKYENIAVGERVQVDHMTVTKNGICVKHFQAWDRPSKFIFAQVFSNAKSRSAKKFLDELIAKAPFKVTCIQVDGGSEFMLDFEAACAEYGIELIVLPPAKPTYNGGVERGNRIFREEFYEPASLQADSLGAMRNELATAVKKYNEYRPHASLKGATPMEYIQRLELEAAA
ncbi:MAG: integrase core domain-containing protein [Legionellaceae bacterium]|nr:integrase core domain-containing protein [Legionellaceae bacterium]